MKQPLVGGRTASHGRVRALLGNRTCALCRFRSGRCVVQGDGPSVRTTGATMPTLDSYLFFRGQCAEAMRFYERTLGGKLEALMTYADGPEPNQCTAGAKDLVMHARLMIDGRALM